MRQFRLREMLESVAWLSVAMAAFTAFLRLDGPRGLTTGTWKNWVPLFLWLIAGIAAGNVVAALLGRRVAWSIIGLCWVFFLILLWDYLSYF